MRLLVTTPMLVIVEVQDVQHVRAEDSTGAFGILPGHTDFLTVLSVSVVTWKDREGMEHHIAVRGGVLTVRDGDLVEIATPEAVSNDKMSELVQSVLERFSDQERAEEQSRLSSAQLNLAAIRQLQRYIVSGSKIIQRVPKLSIGSSMKMDASEK